MTTSHHADGAADPTPGGGAVSVSEGPPPRDEPLVRRVLPEHWEAHRDLRLAMLETDPGAFWARLEDYREMTREGWIQDITGPRLHLQALSGDEVVGGIAVLPQGYTPEEPIREDEANLVSLWVRPASRGSYASRALLRAAARLSIELGRPHLLLDVDSQQLRAAHLYERTGFTASGTRKPREETGGTWVEYAAHAEQVLAATAA